MIKAVVLGLRYASTAVIKAVVLGQRYASTLILFSLPEGCLGLRGMKGGLQKKTEKEREKLGVVGTDR